MTVGEPLRSMSGADRNSMTLPAPADWRRGSWSSADIGGMGESQPLKPQIEASRNALLHRRFGMGDSAACDRSAHTLGRAPIDLRAATMA